MNLTLVTRNALDYVRCFRMNTSQMSEAASSDVVKGQLIIPSHRSWISRRETSGYWRYRNKDKRTLTLNKQWGVEYDS